MGEQTRREMLKLAAGAVLTVPLLRAAAPPEEAPLFFTPEEFRMVDELTEMIIPADEHSGGARAAQVTPYLDRRLAESFEPEPRQLWRDGLKRVNALSVEMFGRPFLEATGEQRVELLTRMARNEREPKELEERFFRQLKMRTARAYYTSKVGIHDEMEYKGNTILEEFAGYDAK